LLGDGGSAGNYPATLSIGRQSPEDRDGINTEMTVKPLVFSGDKCGPDALGDSVNPDPYIQDASIVGKQPKETSGRILDRNSRSLAFRPNRLLKIRKTPKDSPDAEAGCGNQNKDAE
jgi:hypothetical protein